MSLNSSRKCVKLFRLFIYSRYILWREIHVAIKVIRCMKLAASCACHPDHSYPSVKSFVTVIQSLNRSFFGAELWTLWSSHHSCALSAGMNEERVLTSRIKKLLYRYKFIHLQNGCGLILMGKVFMFFLCLWSWLCGTDCVNELHILYSFIITVHCFCMAATININWVAAGNMAAKFGCMGAACQTSVLIVLIPSHRSLIFSVLSLQAGAPLGLRSRGRVLVMLLCDACVRVGIGGASRDPQADHPQCTWNIRMQMYVDKHVNGSLLLTHPMPGSGVRLMGRVASLVSRVCFVNN